MATEEILQPGVMKGKFKLLLLHLIRESPKHGYLLMKELGSLTGYEPSPGSVYPALADLVRSGLVEVRVKGVGGRIVKEYVITDEGIKYLEDRREEVEKVTRILEAARILRDLGLRELGKALMKVFSKVPDLSKDELSAISDALTSCVNSLENALRRVEGNGK